MTYIKTWEERLIDYVAADDVIAVMKNEIEELRQALADDVLWEAQYKKLHKQFSDYVTEHQK